MTQENTRKKALTPREAASAYGLSEGTLANLRCQRKGPRYYRVGRKIIYFVEDVERWLRTCPVLTVDCLPE